MAEKSNKAGRIILAVLTGLILGAVINSLTIQLMVNIIPLPEGIDPNDPESLRAGMERFEFKNYISPWLGHALGTLAGALICTKICGAVAKLLWPMIISVLFLLGGIIMVIMIPNAPVEFILADLLLAYLPMGWLGYQLGKPKLKE